jgi:hypothetical protein
MPISASLLGVRCRFQPWHSWTPVHHVQNYSHWIASFVRSPFGYKSVSWCGGHVSSLNPHFNIRCFSKFSVTTFVPKYNMFRNVSNSENYTACSECQWKLSRRKTYVQCGVVWENTYIFFRNGGQCPGLCIDRCIRRLFNYFKYCLTIDYIMGRPKSIHESTI